MISSSAVTTRSLVSEDFSVGIRFRYGRVFSTYSTLVFGALNHVGMRFIPLSFMWLDVDMFEHIMSGSMVRLISDISACLNRCRRDDVVVQLIIIRPFFMEALLRVMLLFLVVFCCDLC